MKSSLLILEEYLKTYSQYMDKFDEYQNITAKEYIEIMGVRRIFGKNGDKSIKDIFSENKVNNHEVVGVKDNSGNIEVFSKYNLMTGGSGEYTKYEKLRFKADNLFNSINGVYNKIKENPFKTGQYKVFNKERWQNMQSVLDNNMVDYSKIKKLYGNTGNTGI